MARWKLQEPFLDFCGYSASDQFQKVAPNNIISITHLLPAVPYLVPTEKLHNIPKYPILSLFHIFFFINLQFFFLFTFFTCKVTISPRSYEVGTGTAVQVWHQEPKVSETGWNTASSQKKSRLRLKKNLLRQCRDEWKSNYGICRQPNCWQRGRV